MLRRNSLSRNPLGERRTSLPQDQNFFSESNRSGSFLRRIDRDFVIPELPRGQVSIQYFNSVSVLIKCVSEGANTKHFKDLG